MNWRYARRNRLDRDYNSIQNSLAIANYTNPGDTNVVIQFIYPNCTARISQQFRILAGCPDPRCWIFAQTDVNMPTPKVPETLYEPYAQYKPQGGDGTAAKFMNSVLNPPKSLSSITPISAATNGTFTFIVSPEYTAYYNTKYNGELRSMPSTLEGKIRQVIYANGSFFFLKTDSHTIL